MSAPAVSGRLRVLLAGFDVEPRLPEGVGGVRVDVVDRASTAAEAESLTESARPDIVLGDAALTGIAGLQHPGTVAFLRSESASHGGRAMQSFALDLVETVLAVASIRVFCPVER
jgi:hypothetical protein